MLIRNIDANLPKDFEADLQYPISAELTHQLNVHLASKIQTS